VRTQNYELLTSTPRRISKVQSPKGTALPDSFGESPLDVLEKKGHDETKTLPGIAFDEMNSYVSIPHGGMGRFS